MVENPRRGSEDREDLVKDCTRVVLRDVSDIGEIGKIYPDSASTVIC